MGAPFIGEIRMFGGNFAPVGWAFCEGQLLPISENDALFTLIGTTYGGDGQVTFALPDLRGRIPIHQGGSFQLGETGGTEAEALTLQQIPAHTHQANAVGSPANPQAAGANNIWGGVTAGTPYTSQAGNSTLNVGSIASTGGSQPHDNFMPYLCVNFIISLFGVFPTQT